MNPIAARFAAWRSENPGALTALVLLARELMDEERAKGRRPHLTAKLLFELARFRGVLDVTSDEGRRWNNDFTALAARALMRIAPDLEFEVRERKAEAAENERREESSHYTGELFA